MVGYIQFIINIRNIMLRVAPYKTVNFLLSKKL